MRITPDSNILLRAVLLDDEGQGQAASKILRESDLIAVTLPTLCEFVWVLRQGRKISSEVVATKIRQLLASERVMVDRAAVDAGLAMIDRGGDFADGVIAFEGRRLGGEIFVTFDKDAATLTTMLGHGAELVK